MWTSLSTPEATSFVKMPRCEGRPDGACPMKVNNSSVKLTQGDLMLCRDCDQYRFPTVTTAVSKQDYSSTSSKATTSAPVPLPVTNSSNDRPSPEENNPGVERKVVINELLFFSEQFLWLPGTFSYSENCRWFLPGGRNNYSEVNTVPAHRFITRFDYISIQQKTYRRK